MARKKKLVSLEADKLRARVSGMKSIAGKLDLGSGISVAALEKVLATLDASVKAYNTALSALDKQTNEINKLEKQAASLASRALSLGAGKYGRDSSEYEMLGGVRSSERKKKAKPKPVTK